MRTRAKATKPVSKKASTSTSIPAPAQHANDPNPPKLLVLPQNATAEARIVTLANPRTSTPNRYYFCPEKGFYEFTKLAAPKSVPRSWLLAKQASPKAKANSDEAAAKPIENDGAANDAPSVVESSVDVTEPNSSSSEGYIMNSADLLVATPLDPIFLLLPALSPTSPSTKSETPNQLFISFDDHIDTLTDALPKHARIFSHPKIRRLLEDRMEAICDTVDAGDEKMYRLSHEKLLKVLLGKAEQAVRQGLPASLEEKFVRRALEVPIMSVKREDSSISLMAEESIATEGPAAATASPRIEMLSESTSSEPSLDSQTNTSTPATSVSDAASAPVTQESPSAASKELLHLLRLRISLDFILASYIQLPLTTKLNALLSLPTSPLNFAPLTEHLDKLAALRAEALASRSLGDFSRKRGFEEDDEAMEGRAERKRKKEEEEKRKKAGESRAMRELKKVDTSGMRKMSDFFGKKPASKKK
ncbi:MAG: hypothetical protein M1819_003918 [Sarea resinae]|nr:MAG: hypothetical protein M1819_003918 [Sarea resinae]